MAVWNTLAGIGKGAVTGFGMGGPLGAVAGGILGGATAGGDSSDSSSGNAGPPPTPYQVSADPYNLGGYNQGAQDWSDDAMARAQRAQDLGDQWETQGASQIQNSQDMDANSRGYQSDALGLMRDAAYGNAPSVAQNQLQQGMNQQIANQSSQLGSARGAQGLAMAQQNSAGALGNTLANTNAAAAQLRAEEMANARGAYGGLATGQRGQDQSMGQLGIQMGQLGLGHQQLSQGYAGQGYGMVQGQANLQAEAEKQRQAAYEAAQRNQYQANKDNLDRSAAREAKWIDAGTQLASTATQAAAKAGA